ASQAIAAAGGTSTSQTASTICCGTASATRRRVVSRRRRSCSWSRTTRRPFMRDTVVSVLRAACLVLGIAILAGCGAKSYTAQADAICKKYTKQTNAFAKPTNIDELAALADKTLP